MKLSLELAPYSKIFVFLLSCCLILDLSATVSIPESPISSSSSPCQHLSSFSPHLGIDLSTLPVITSSSPCVLVLISLFSPCVLSLIFQLSFYFLVMISQLLFSLCVLTLTSRLLLSTCLGAPLSPPSLLMYWCSSLASFSPLALALTYLLFFLHHDNNLSVPSLSLSASSS